MLRFIRGFIRRAIITIIPMNEYIWKMEYCERNNLDPNNNGCWKIARLAFSEYLKGKDI
jgi:hypothetical protein